MKRRLRSFLCFLKGRHEDECMIFVLRSIGIQEHLHICASCETVTHASVTPIIAVMGMSIPDQQEYLQ